MKEFELLEQLENIIKKINDDQELTEYETKLFATILFGFSLGIIKNATELLLNKIKVIENEKE